MKSLLILNPNAGIRSLNNLKMKQINYLKKELNSNIINLNKLNADQLKGYKEIIVAGGDGTLQKIINLLLSLNLNKDINLGFFPFGHGNAMSYACGIKNHRELLKAIKNRNIKKIDLIKLKTKDHKLYTFFLGAGLTAEIVKNTKGKNRHLFSYLLNITNTFAHKINPSRLKIKTDKKEFEIKKNIFVTIGKHPFLGYGFKVNPRAKIDDGFLHVVFYEEKVPNYILPINFIPLVFGFYDFWKYVRTKKIKIKSQEPLHLHSSGEYLGKFDNFSLEIVPRAINFYFK